MDGPPQLPPLQIPPSSPLSSTVHFEAPNLRKSISIGSFATNRQAARPSASSSHAGAMHSPANPEPSRTSSRPGAQTAFVGGWYDRDRALQHLHNTSGNNTAPISTSADDDLNYIQSVPTSGSASEARPNSATGAQRASQQLWLPERLNTLKKPSSTVSLTSATSSSEQSARLTPLLSQSVSGKPSAVSLASSSTGRFRSGSLDQIAGRAAIARKDAQREPKISHLRQSSSPEVCVAVVGVSQCGKSTFIRKALKPYSISLGSASSSGSTSSHAPFPYISHTAVLSKYPQGVSERIIRVMEINASALNSLSSPETSVWPSDAPRVDGVILAYDASDMASFRPIPQLLAGFGKMRLPLVVVACKTELQGEHRVASEEANDIARQYDTGLVEVNAITDEGKERIRLAFDWLVKSILRTRRSTSVAQGDGYRNPASPDVLAASPPWERVRSEASTPTPATLASTPRQTSPAPDAPSLQRQQELSAHTPIPPLRTPTTPRPLSPMRARSMGDLVTSSEQVRNGSYAPRELEREHSASTMHSTSSYSNDSSASSLLRPPNGQAWPMRESDIAEGMTSVEEIVEEGEHRMEREPKPPTWGSLDDLIQKLLYVTVSGDDPIFISHFLLVYRRFSGPRPLLLAMQKRLRELDASDISDDMLADFAQMRICHLLDMWIRDYPHDFAVRGTYGALSALVKSILMKTQLLHYGSDFLPFLELLPNLSDKDASWAMKVDHPADESDESYTDEEDLAPAQEPDVGSSQSDSSASFHSFPEARSPDATSAAIRERKSSLPLSSYRDSSHATTSPVNSRRVDPEAQLASRRYVMRELQRIGQEVALLDPTYIAREITLTQVDLFLQIEPRHWLFHTFVSGKKDSEPSGSVARLNRWTDVLGSWVESLVLSHDKPKARAKQIEKFVDVAEQLVAMQNFGGLRGVVSGINGAITGNSSLLELLTQKFEGKFELLQSYSMLLASSRGHRAYRLALRSSKGAVIPACEIHISDLLRSHEGNPDVSPVDPTKIHWGKWNLMAKFIDTITDCQRRCRTSPEYEHLASEHRKERELAKEKGIDKDESISKYWRKEYVMDDELKNNRREQPIGHSEERPPVFRASSKDRVLQAKDLYRRRKLVFW